MRRIELWAVGSGGGHVASVPAGRRSTHREPTVMAPQSRPATMIGAATTERPCSTSRASCGRIRERVCATRTFCSIAVWGKGAHPAGCDASAAGGGSMASGAGGWGVGGVGAVTGGAVVSAGGDGGDDAGGTVGFDWEASGVGCGAGGSGACGGCGAGGAAGAVGVGET